ncbi:hypothetical protein F0562_025072 [Nyssa sinensis]|uniref:Uncharacterized protein n=1 Tax=Nyssa sinensis TaxID=561372 RepID=A0A5J5BEH3_9ASTE|nr:hypothetical protein F0562_025072 [Nyssa sinensis]
MMVSISSQGNQWLRSSGKATAKEQLEDYQKRPNEEATNAKVNSLEKNKNLDYAFVLNIPVDLYYLGQDAQNDYAKVLSGFRPLRKKKAAVGELTTSILAKKVATGNGSSLERTVTRENAQGSEALPFSIELSNSRVILDIDVVGTSTPSSRMRGKEIVTQEHWENVSARTLEENDLGPPTIEDTLKMAWELSWDKITKELAQALHIMVVLSEIRFESHNLEAQLQFQFMSFTEAANMIDELKKKLEGIKTELETAWSTTNHLKEQLEESSNIVSLQDSEIISLKNEVANMKK